MTARASSLNRVSERPGQGQMVLDVSAGLGQVHALEVDAQVDGVGSALAQTAAQGRLTDQEEGGRGAAAHGVVAEHAQVLELVGLEEVGSSTMMDVATALGPAVASDSAALGTRPTRWKRGEPPRALTMRPRPMVGLGQ